MLGLMHRHEIERGKNAAILLPVGNVDAVPEGDVAADISGGFLRLRVVPGGILVRLPIDDKVVIAGLTLPAAQRMVVALLKVLAVDRVHRKVVAPFDDNRRIALGKDRPVP